MSLKAAGIEITGKYRANGQLFPYLKHNRLANETPAHPATAHSHLQCPAPRCAGKVRREWVISAELRCRPLENFVDKGTNWQSSLGTSITTGNSLGPFSPWVLTVSVEYPPVIRPVRH